MDWDALLADLESRFEAERRAEIAAQAADLAEAEIASLRVADRLRGALGRTVRLRTCGGVPVDGVLTRAEDGFVLVEEGDGLQALVPTGSLAFLSPLPGPSPEPDWHRRPTFQAAARELARTGARVRAVTSAGDIIGRIGRVGADYIDILVDGPHGGSGDPRPAGGAPRTGVVTVCLTALDVLRSR